MRATSSSSSGSSARRGTPPASAIRTSSGSTTAARPRAPTTSRWSTSTGRRSRSCSSARARRPPLTAIKFAREILSALAEAHRHDIVHRDIKPHNVIVSPDWNVKVTDFGIARSGASQMTEAGSIVGTAQYLSPEQARGKPVDQRSDLYSLGIVLYEMLTGTVPFTGDAAVEIAMKHLSNDPRARRRSCGREDLARPRRGRDARAREGSRPAVRLGRGDGRRPGPRRARRRRLAADRGGDDAGRWPAPGHDLGDDDRPAGRRDAAAGAARLPAARPTTRRPAAAARRWPMLLGLVAIAIAAVGGYLIYNKVTTAIDTNAPVAVQNVEQLPVKNAERSCTQQGLQTHRSARRAARSRATLVISQNPSPGDRVVEGHDRHAHRLDRRCRRRPSRRSSDLPLGAGGVELENEGLHWSVHNVTSSTVEPGSVTASSPAEGAARPRRHHGHGSTSRPGRRRSASRRSSASSTRTPQSALKGAGFKVTRSDVANAAPVDQVVAQSPGAGSSASPGSTITLSVSTGPQELVRPVGHRRRPDRRPPSCCSTAGFTVPVVQQDVTDPQQDGLVLNQSPGERDEAQAGRGRHDHGRPSRDRHRRRHTTTTPDDARPRRTTPVTPTTAATTTADDRRRPRRRRHRPTPTTATDADRALNESP